MITDEGRTRLYPQEDEVGDQDTWDLPLGSIDPASTALPTNVLTIEGTFLGVATARQDKHNHPGPTAPPGRRCPACRWFEPRIFHLDDGRYFMYTLGCSNMPGESDRPRYRYANDAYEAIFVMSTVGDEGNRFLSAPAQKMFVMASDRDPALKEALLSQWSQAAPAVEDRWQS